MNPGNQEKITQETLNSQLYKLSALLSDPSSNVKEAFLVPYLHKLCYFAQMLNLTFNVELKSERSLCIHCQATMQNSSITLLLKLDCGKHAFCNLECAKNFIGLYTEDQILNWTSLKCPICQISFSKKFLENTFGPEAFRQMLEKASVDREVKFTCNICMMEYLTRQAITLNCIHRFCTDCMKNYLETKITEGQVSDEDLLCPQCPAEDKVVIDNNIIQYIVSQDNYERYLKFTFNQWKPDLDDDELYFECHGVDCTNRIILPVTDQEYKCAACGFVSCPRCGDVVHKGSSCEAFKAWKEENNQADAKFQELMKNSQWIQCPWCKQVIERTHGCKYMSCFSTECRGKKFFCFDCKQGLVSDHARHNCTTPG